MAARGIIKKIVRFFLSRNVAIVLLILMMVLLVLSTKVWNLTFLPDEEVQLLKEQSPNYYAIASMFGDGGIASTPYFYILPTFIFLSTLFCTIERLLKTSKKDLGFWGSMVFHAGLLTVIVAGAITNRTLFEGEVLLTEGYPFPLGREGYLQVTREPAGGVALPEGSITLTKFSSKYKGQFATDHDAEVELFRNGVKASTVIKVNHPLYVDDFQYTLTRYGFSPAFVVKDEKSETLVDAFINLVVVEGQEDAFEVPGTGIVVYVRFHPDFEMTKEGPRTRSPLPNNPVAAVKVRKGLKDTKFRHVILGEEVELEGLTISFPELKYW
ncbi:MAG: cytochrome c biogenesis protein ResB, partial [Thermodesulfovibrionia bacterium]|nr:cytochrome c biogenesis protein ResB [Thermodesulfovibrionia bacterium]